MQESLARGRASEVAELLDAEHERLQIRLLDLLEDLRAAGAPWPAAAVELGRFRSELEQVMRMEEDVLFRELERLAPPGEARPTLALWMDHAELQALLDQARCVSGDEAALRCLLEALRDRLEVHCQQETALIRALLGRCAWSPDLDRLERRLQICLAPL